MKRSWYSSSIAEFQKTSDDQVFGELLIASTFPDLISQKHAWIEEITILRTALNNLDGWLHLEFEIPRMGRRVDAVLLINGIVLSLEFKIDAVKYLSHDIDQAYDYALDLKYFHEASHNLVMIPILVASKAQKRVVELTKHPRIADLYKPLCTNSECLASVIDHILKQFSAKPFDPELWANSKYCPTPTIIEAARELYAGHDVAGIARNDAGSINLTRTSELLYRIIEQTRSNGQKAICFVTGVPGAGKTLVGLNIATKYNDPDSELHSVFLSGNKPLVDILREALARDTVHREFLKVGKKGKKGDALTRVKAFIQNVHHFRDECLRDNLRPPVDHVALFDEAQRAWNREQTATFMRQKKGVPDFQESEPEYLISCMDRRNDWAVIVCLVGGGQEINTGEAGIGAWIEAFEHRYPEWHLYISPALTDSEYGAGKILQSIATRNNVHYQKDLHLAISMRSFRAETVSEFVKTVLDCEISQAHMLYQQIQECYPIVLTRDLDRAKAWLREHASGTERYGIVVSSQADRLKPYAIDVRSPMNPVKWFLDGKDDVRSSYYLEDVATEFQVQGLELDWVCLSWDGDFRYHNDAWNCFSFRGNKWQNIKKPLRQQYLKNAYRVLLTRARQGMVIFIPEGSPSDPTRNPAYYDATYSYLRSVGIRELS
jgi:hypothetical protein